MHKTFSSNKGFTLVELLIVIIILSVLAAIVIPQFSGSTQDAKESALQSTLAEMRNAIELYYHQHGNTYPGANPTTAGGADGGTEAAFLAQLTTYTNAAGVVANVKDTTFKYGPYLKKQEIPQNPLATDTNNLNTVTIIKTGDTNAGNITEPGAAGATAWWFDTVSGKFVAYNNAAYLDW